VPRELVSRRTSNGGISDPSSILWCLITNRRCLNLICDERNSNACEDDDDMSCPDRLLEAKEEAESIFSDFSITMIYMIGRCFFGSDKMFTSMNHDQWLHLQSYNYYHKCEGSWKCDRQLNLIGLKLHSAVSPII
jgi:hypothetical protein